MTMTKKECEKDLDDETRFILVDGKLLTLRSVIDHIIEDDCEENLEKNSRRLSEG